MNLQLNRPLAFFDLETTGINLSSDRIVEIAIVKILPGGEKVNYRKVVNPEIPIPVHISEIHGIYDVDVIDAPKFAEIAQEVLDFIGDSDLAGFNSNRFDIPLLLEEFLRVDIDFDMDSRQAIDVQNIFHKMEQRTLVAAYKFYCSKDLTDAHSAEADALATFEVLEAQLGRYENLKSDVDFLSEFSNAGGKRVDFANRLVRNDKDEIVFNFGKHRGAPVTAVFEREKSYYSWLMNADFPLYTKKIFKKIKEGMPASN